MPNHPASLDLVAGTFSPRSSESIAVLTKAGNEPWEAASLELVEVFISIVGPLLQTRTVILDSRTDGVCREIELGLKESVRVDCFDVERVK